MNRRIYLVVIDNQNDFADPAGSLFVPGADADSRRLSALVRRLGARLARITVTLDSHYSLHIAHPVFWRDAQGTPPPPFTIISAADVLGGHWAPRNPAWTEPALRYVQTLEHNGRYPLCIWPRHCVIGSWGHALVPEFSDTLTRWQEETLQPVAAIWKGSSLMTEHYSAVRADVPDKADPATQPNIGFLNGLRDADEILIAGQALSHCVANTFRDVAREFGPENVARMVLLRDATSSVPGFEAAGDNFVSEMTTLGMLVATTADYGA